MKIKMSIGAILVLIKEFLKETEITIFSLIKIIFESHLWKLKCKVSLNTANKKCVILVNGPSLNTDLEQYDWIFNEEYVWCVNSFATTELYVKIKPKFYLFSDPGWWDANPPENVKTLRKKVIERIKSNTTWNMYVFLPFGVKNTAIWKDIDKQSQNIKICEFNQTAITGFKFFRYYCYKYRLGTPTPYNVLIPTLINSLNMGFKEIFVAGADHSMFKTIFVGDDNFLYKKDEHFYAKDKARICYQYGYKYGGCNDTNPMNIAYFLETQGILFKNHQYIREYADSCNARIINLTRESFIDAYERYKYDSIEESIEK